MAKRKHEFVDYEEIDCISDEEIGSAIVHGVVTHVSPVKVSKKGNNYFHGEVSDGKKALRFVGFVPRQQEQLKEYQRSRRSVEMRNIQVKPSLRDTSKKEILVKGTSKISPSTQEFDTTGLDFHANEGIRIFLSDVNGIEPLTIVTVLVKVFRCEKPITLGTKQKQDILVSDTTDQGVVQLWEENIGMLQEGRSYQLTNFRVVEYEQRRYLGMCWDGSNVNEVDDLSNAIDISAGTAEVNLMDCVMEAPGIAAVYRLETTYKCLRCGSRTEPGGVAGEARCSRSTQCGILNKTDFCEKFIMAELLVVSTQTLERKVLTAFGKDTLCELLGESVECSAITEEGLLGAPRIQQLTYKNNEIVKVSRS